MRRRRRKTALLLVVEHAPKGWVLTLAPKVPVLSLPQAVRPNTPPICVEANAIQC